MTKERFKDICIFGLVACVIALFFLRDCHREPKPVNQIDLKPELKAQDSLKDKVDSLDKVSKTLLINAYRKDSTIGFYVNKYRFYKAKFLSKHDSMPHGKEILFITQSCDSVIAQDSIRNLAWKELHKNDSTQISSLKSLVNVDSVIIFKQGLMLKADSIHIVKLDKKVKRNRRLALFFGAIVAGGVGVKLIP